MANQRKIGDRPRFKFSFGAIRDDSTLIVSREEDMPLCLPDLIVTHKKASTCEASLNVYSIKR